MKLFAIQHIPTGQFLPASRNGRRGQTYVTPEDPRTHCSVPRLFHEKQHAKQSLDWWLAGRVIKGYDDCFGNYVDGVRPDASRVPADWKVVEVRLEIV